MAGSGVSARLARPFDPAELRRIKRLLVRHAIAVPAGLAEPSATVS